MEGGSGDGAGGKCLSVKQGHTDEVLDVCFDSSGTNFVSASADGTARVYSTRTGACLHTYVGHDGEISKVSFNPQGTSVITASSDKTCRIWNVSSGGNGGAYNGGGNVGEDGGDPSGRDGCAQVLEGHMDEIFSCAFNYEGDHIITGSKDNTCRIWKAKQ